MQCYRDGVVANRDGVNGYRDGVSTFRDGMDGRQTLVCVMSLLSSFVVLF